MRLTFYFIDGSQHVIVVPIVEIADDICDSIANGRNVNIEAGDGVFVAVAANVIRILGVPL